MKTRVRASVYECFDMETRRELHAVVLETERPCSGNCKG